MHRLLIATRNRHKTQELAAMLGAGFHIEDLSAHTDFPEVEETGATFLDNAAIKAIAASNHFGGDTLVMADDSGLEVDALGGAPGVRSARFADPGANDRKNLELLLEKLTGVELRSARFRCVIAVARNGQVLASFDGACEGEIIGEARGSAGFGYDPVFVPTGHSETFAEIGAELKNQMSHRAKALKSALEWLKRL
ncbi:MAG: RdgB/HAM1 family non-canonical purine NTP pyrophosphatase [Verrucomicrobiota bacterium]